VARTAKHGRNVRSMGAGEFKTHCLRLMDEVAERHDEILITKYGKPVARLVPAEDEVPDSFGALAGTVRYRDDIVPPDHEAWDEGAA
jgi:prevent-host-death family protein